MPKKDKKFRVGEKLQVEIQKITIGRDSRMYLTISHPLMDNEPTLRLKEEI